MRFKICLTYDVIDWAFYDISINLKRTLHEFDIDVKCYLSDINSDDYDLIVAYSPTCVPLLNDYSNLLCGISSHINLDVKISNVLRYKNIFTNDLSIYNKIIRYKSEDRRVFKIRNGVDTDFFSYMKKNQVGISNNFKIGTVGSYKRMEHKGMYRIEEMVKFLNEKDVGYEVINSSLFVDPSNMKSKYQLLEYYKTLDIFIMSSVSETGPNVLLEALSCGVPCVVNNTGMAKDVVVIGENGYIVEKYRDISTYIFYIEKIINNYHHYNRRINIEKYDWGVISLEYSEMFKNILKK